MQQSPDIRRMEAYLLYFVSGVGDALCDALVRANGCCQFCVVLHNQFIQVTITLLIGFFKTPLLVFSVFNIITGRQGPGKDRIYQAEANLKPKSRRRMS